MHTLVSGSPIIQNGKLVGAVTHVLINDPTTGVWNFYRKYAQRGANADGEGIVTEKIVGRWLATAVANAYNQTIRREMNPRPTSKTAN